MSLDPSVHGLVTALRRHGPQPTWGPADHRRAFEDAAVNRALHPDVTITPVDGLSAPAERYRPADRRGTETILYLHGGGFIMGSLATTRPLATHLSAATGRDVVVLGYDLAPEQRHPHQVQQTVAAFEWLRAAGEVVLAGDSAGGALALAAAQHAVATDQRPHALVLLSPLLDLRLVAPSIDAHEPYDPQTPRWLLQQMVDHVLGGAAPDDPVASPLLGRLDALPPTLIQAAELECLSDDARRFAEAATAAGSSHVELQMWSGMIHVWHAFAPRLSAATRALDDVGRWLDELSPRA